jgi:hypothetical protein
MKMEKAKYYESTECFECCKTIFATERNKVNNRHYCGECLLKVWYNPASLTRATDEWTNRKVNLQIKGGEKK